MNGGDLTGGVLLIESRKLPSLREQFPEWFPNSEGDPLTHPQDLLNQPCSPVTPRCEQESCSDTSVTWSSSNQSVLVSPTSVHERTSQPVLYANFNELQGNDSRLAGSQTGLNATNVQTGFYSNDPLTPIKLKQTSHKGEVCTFECLVRKAEVKVHELRSKHITKETEGEEHNLTPTDSRQEILRGRFRGSHSDPSQDSAQAKDRHGRAEGLRREEHALFLSMLNCFSGDVMDRLRKEKEDSNQAWEFEKYLPRGILGESKAKNNRDGINKNLSFVAAIIKLMMLLETQELECLARKELESQVAKLESLLQRHQASHCSLLV